MNANERLNQIVAAAVEIAERDGLHNVTCTVVAKAVGLRHSSVLHHVKSADILREMTAREAIKLANKKILASMITDNHMLARDIPAALRRDIIAGLV